MKFKIFFLAIFTIIILQIQGQLNPYIFNNQKDNKNEHNNIRYGSETNDYNPIRIYPDFSYIKDQSKVNSNLSKIEQLIEDSLKNTIKLVQKLIKVIPLSDPINKITSEDLFQWGFHSNNFNKALLESGSGVEADLIILLRFLGIKEENLLKDNEFASISNKFILNEITKRPIVGVIYLNSNIDLNLENVDIYLKYIFLHELTHILGFHYDLFQYFPGGLQNTIKTKKEKRTNKEKKFITTPKVVNFAKKYYNCDKIDGVELEDQHDIPWSHWEARILLGEYMTSSPYTPEQVVSEFTLALLEDSGWYKANYFTGGLMRFGKNKGCNFLNNDCANKATLKSNFKSEFCDFDEGNQPTCSSGRQSRTYCKSYIGLNEKNYKRFGAWFGRINADNCPVSDVEIEEEKKIYYVGNCKYGNGKYGTHNNFGNENLSNENFMKILGEKYGSNSFCALSNILPEIEREKHKSFIDSPRAICYPMFCSSKSLTIQIFDEFIVCPREGGKVQLSGKYSGYILCPDYNLICTGTQFCNDMFDCIEKESLSKEETFNYDYTVNNNENKIYKAEELAELGEDGLCPKNCAQCEDKKKCIKCLDGYAFAAENKFSSLVQCIKEDEINIEKYCYNDNGIYYNCDWKIEKDNINEEIKEDILNGKIDDVVQNYIEKTNYTEKLIIYYTTENLSIIIYKGKGNKELLESLSSFDTKELFELLNEHYPNDSNKKIKCIINENGNYYISIYDDKGKKINIEKECPECSNIKINIKNNYENNLNKVLGTQIKNAIFSMKKVDIFNPEDKIFKDICSNFTVSGIDIPVNKRKDVFYLGDEKNEIICGSPNCKIVNDKYDLNKLVGECKCDVNLNNNYIKINTNNKTDIMKNKTLTEISNSETWKNSFEIFKCLKNRKFMKGNEGFYISICSISVQSVCFLLYIVLNPKMAVVATLANPGKKTGIKKIVKTDDSSNEIMNKKDDNDNDKDDIKSKEMINGHKKKIKNNIINYGNRDEDKDEKYAKNKDGMHNTNFHYPGVKDLKLDTIKIENKCNFKDLSTKSLSEERQRSDENDKSNKNKNKNKKNNSNTNANNANINNKLVYNTTEERINNNNNNNNNDNKSNDDNNNKGKESSDNNDAFSFQGSVNKKLNFMEKEEKIYEEKIKNKKILILFGNKTKKKKIYDNEKMDKGKNKILPLDYLTLEKAIKYDKRSFKILYWSIFSLKQPLINMLSFFKMFKITESCIPMQMKLIRFLLMLILNLFINSMTITQNYFKDKYDYFNRKYNLEKTDAVKIKIDPLERLSYAMNHCFPEVIFTFFICMISQFIINFIFFKIRRELCLISINEKKENINKEVQKLIKKAKVRYIIFSFINLIFMIIFFIYLTNFTAAYSGGALDYIGAGIWTFIFLQILPAISSLIISLLRYYGMKKNHEGMYKMSQVLLA